MKVIKLYKDIKKALELKQLYNELSLIDKITKDNIHMVEDIKKRTRKVIGENSNLRINLVVAELENALYQYESSLNSTNLINDLDGNPKVTQVVQFSFDSKRFLYEAKNFLKEEYLLQLTNCQHHLMMMCLRYINEFIDAKKYNILKKLLILSESDFEEIKEMMLKIYVIDNNYIEIQKM